MDFRASSILRRPDRESVDAASQSSSEGDHVDGRSNFINHRAHRRCSLRMESIHSRQQTIFSLRCVRGHRNILQQLEKRHRRFRQSKTRTSFVTKIYSSIPGRASVSFKIGVMLVSVTRLRVRSLGYLLPFLLRTVHTTRQVRRAAGFFGGRLLVDAHLTFWTLTVWESEKAMKSFRGSGSHARVMPRLAHWCDEASYAHWTSTDSVPTWPEAYEHLVAEGRLSRVNHPSPDHEARHFPTPRLKPMIGNRLKPVD
jgi:hypothetical protein